MSHLKDFKGAELNYFPLIELFWIIIPLGSHNLNSDISNIPVEVFRQRITNNLPILMLRNRNRKVGMPG